MLVHAVVALTFVGQVALQNALDERCQTFMSQSQVVGMSVAIIKNDQVVFSRGYGDASIGERKASEKTIYRLGSVSKPVTAVIAMSLVESGKLDLDSDIRKWAPEFPEKGDRVTARHILTHTSGIRHYAGGNEAGITKTYTQADAIKLFGNSDLLFRPGTKRSYSTHAFTVLARALEVAGGTSFEKQVDEIARRGKAATLKCERLDQIPGDRSKLYGYDSVGKPTEYKVPENNSWKFAGGGMESSAPDLATFANNLLLGRILPAKAVAEMWRPQDTLDNRASGLGWFLVAEEQAEHGGSQQGCRAHLRIFRKSGIVIAVLTNTSSQRNSPATLTTDLGRLIEREANR